VSFQLGHEDSGELTRKKEDRMLNTETAPATDTDRKRAADNNTCSIAAGARKSRLNFLGPVWPSIGLDWEELRCLRAFERRQEPIDIPGEPRDERRADTTSELLVRLEGRVRALEAALADRTEAAEHLAVDRTRGLGVPL
jgi:hypothetical protein